MGLVKRSRAEDSEPIKWPYQSNPPSLRQVQAMFETSLQNQGRHCRLCFGESPEEYALTVTKERHNNQVLWALYRANSETSLMLWEKYTHDAAFIHMFICAQFPGLDPLLSVTTNTIRPEDLKLQKLDSEATAEADNSQHSQTEVPAYGKPAIAGELTNTTVANVLQSIADSRASGKLVLQKLHDSSAVYFVDGAVTHCIYHKLDGVPALIEVLGWRQGHFSFFPGEESQKISIKRELESVLVESARLYRQLQELDTRGINGNTFLIRVEKMGVPEVSDGKTSVGKFDSQLFQRLYMQLDGSSRLIDLVRRFRLRKEQWVPVVFDWAKNGLVDVTKRISASPAIETYEANFDWSQSNAAERTLLDGQSNFYNEPAILLHLDMEHERWERFGHPYSILILQCFSAKDTIGPGRLEPVKINRICECIVGSKRQTDLAAFYNSSTFLVICPETDRNAATLFAHRLADRIGRLNFDEDGDPLDFATSLGYASVPDDCDTLAELLVLAAPSPLSQL